MYIIIMDVHQFIGHRLSPLIHWDFRYYVTDCRRLMNHSNISIHFFFTYTKVNSLFFLLGKFLFTFRTSFVFLFIKGGYNFRIKLKKIELSLEIQLFFFFLKKIWGGGYFSFFGVVGGVPSPKKIA